MADLGQELAALDRKRMDAMCRKDQAMLRELLADELVYTHSSGRMDTKQSIMAGIDSGTSDYKSIDPTDVKATVVGDTVVVTGAARIKVTASGNPLDFGVRFTDVWVKRGGGWQMVAWQSTRLPD